MSRIIIALDGPAGSGKSTVAKSVAMKLGITYLDSGAIYRAVTLYLLSKFGEIPASVNADDILKEMQLTQKFHPDGSSRTYINGEDVSDSIRSEDIVKTIGRVSDNPEIRGAVNRLLREWSQAESVIMDGRDIGTVVFPAATIKFYLDASADVRAERRCGEYDAKGVTCDFDSVREQIIVRDRQDMNRAVGALKQADDAVYIDTSEMPVDEVTAALLEQIQKKM